MKVVFRKDIICAAVPPLMSGVSTKMTMPATEGILIEATMPSTCVLTTYDVEKGVRLTIEADVIEEGRAIINANKFSQIVRIMDDNTITLTVDDRLNTTIVSGRSSHTMLALDAKDFPEIPHLTSQHGFVVNQKAFRGLMSKAMYAMGVNDQRPVLNGMYFSVENSRLSVVSCDSFKMAVCATDTDLTDFEGQKETEDIRFIIPNKSINELHKLLGDGGEEDRVTVYVGRKNIIFVMNDVTFFSKLIDGEYVNYNRIIIRNHRITVKTDRELLISALEHAALITEEKVAGSVRSHVKLEVAGDLLKISATSGTGSAYGEVPVEHEGEDLIIAFNNRYLIDSLRASDADRVKISLSSPLTSINIESADDDSTDEDLFYLLPVRMKE